MQRHNDNVESPRVQWEKKKKKTSKGYQARLNDWQTFCEKLGQCYTALPPVTCGKWYFLLFYSMFLWHFFFFVSLKKTFKNSISCCFFSSFLSDTGLKANEHRWECYSCINAMQGDATWRCDETDWKVSALRTALHDVSAQWKTCWPSAFFFFFFPPPHIHLLKWNQAHFTVTLLLTRVKYWTYDYVMGTTYAFSTTFVNIYKTNSGHSVS